MTTDQTLLARAATGDADAFAALFDRHVRAVYWQAYHVVGDADLAQDVAQESFITAWRRRGEIRIEDSLLPWLLVTARHIALNHGRKRARLRAVPLEATPEPRTPDHVDDAVVRDAIDAAVARLSPVDRELFALCVEGDHTYESAAAELGLTHAAVRNRVSRLRGRLRRDLMEEDA